MAIDPTSLTPVIPAQTTVVNNATQTTRPNGSQVDRSFDAFGNVLTQTEAFNGAVTTYSYDPFSLVTARSFPAETPFACGLPRVQQYPVP